MLPAPLPQEQVYAIGRAMRLIHDRVRARQGLEPLPSAWSIDDGSMLALLGGIRGLRDGSSLSDPSVLGSHRRVVGRLIATVRRAFWRPLKAVFDRQSGVNRELANALECLAVEHVKLVRAADALATRVVELELQTGHRRRGQ
jgi:hypothetical protein